MSGKSSQYLSGRRLKSVRKKADVSKISSPKNVGRSKLNAAGKKKSDSSIRNEFSAGFILFRETPAGRLYLLLDYGRHWDYPKGHLEEGETAWKAAVRELREETGIRQVDRVSSFRRQMEYTFYSPKKRSRIHKTVTYFTGSTTVETVNVSDEHTGYAWLSYESAMKQLTYENARQMLRAAHEALEKN